jgi:hypothetical protein
VSTLQCSIYLMLILPCSNVISSVSSNCFLVTNNFHPYPPAGLDIVPLQPDLQQIGWSELAPRIKWVQANLCVVSHHSDLWGICFTQYLVWRAYPSRMKNSIMCAFITLNQLEILTYFGCSRIQRVARGVPEDKVGLSSPLFGSMFMLHSGIHYWKMSPES